MNYDTQTASDITATMGEKVQEENIEYEPCEEMQALEKTFTNAGKKRGQGKQAGK